MSTVNRLFCLDAAVSKAGQLANLSVILKDLSGSTLFSQAGNAVGQTVLTEDGNGSYSLVCPYDASWPLHGKIQWKFSGVLYTQTEYDVPWTAINDGSVGEVLCVVAASPTPTTTGFGGTPEAGGSLPNQDDWFVPPGGIPLQVCFRSGALTGLKVPIVGYSGSAAYFVVDALPQAPAIGDHFLIL